MHAFLTRRSLMGGSLAMMASANARADDRIIEIRPGGAFKPVSIAVTSFGGEGENGAKLSGIISNNFRRSVYLSPLDPKTFAETIASPDQPPQMDAWKIINAQFVLTGRSARGGDGRLQTEFRLWDVATGQQVAGQQYVTDANNSRRVAHIISDAVFTRITGEKGFFDSRVVFVDETGP